MDFSLIWEIGFTSAIEMSMLTHVISLLEIALLRYN